MSLHKKSNHIFSRTIVKGIFFPNTTTQQQRLHITTPTTNPIIRKIRIVNMSVLFEYNFSFPFIPHSYQNVTIPHSLSQTTFFSRPAAHPLKIRKQNRLSNTKKQRNHTNATPKASKKAIPRPPPTKFQKQTPQKDIPKQSIKSHQLENTPTQTAIQIHTESAQTPLKTHTPQNARTLPLKRKCISLQTPKSLLPNAKAFHLKRKYI